MAYNNSIIMKGNLTRDFERYEKVCSVGLAVNRKGNDRDGNPKSPMFITLKYFTADNSIATTLADTFKKGDFVEVHGSLDINTYTKADKTQGTSVEITVDQLVKISNTIYSVKKVDSWS